MSASISRYEKNIFLQPAIIHDAIESAKAPWMAELKTRRLFFVGIGTSYHAAELAKMMWRDYVSAQAFAVNSFDFVKTPQPISEGDVVVVFSHRGTKSYSVESANLASAAGCITVGVTSKGSPWEKNLSHKIETCESEDTGGFTKSLTCALAMIAKWIDDDGLCLGFKKASEQLAAPLDFPKISENSDVVLIGDLSREWVARETALKIQETAYLPARAFGLEEFLHGPRVSIGPRSMVIAFAKNDEPRWQSALNYLQAIDARVVKVEPKMPVREANWLWQLFWGQRFALDICRQLGIDPDALRTHDEKYKKARETLVM